jgi:hypothetical protein
MESSSKGEIVIKWSPTEEEDFILVGSSINFYRLTSIDASCTIYKKLNQNLSS